MTIVIFYGACHFSRSERFQDVGGANPFGENGSMILSTNARNGRRKFEVPMGATSALKKPLNVPPPAKTERSGPEPVANPIDPARTEPEGSPTPNPLPSAADLGDASVARSRFTAPWSETQRSSGQPERPSRLLTYGDGIFPCLRPRSVRLLPGALEKMRIKEIVGQTRRK